MLKNVVADMIKKSPKEQLKSNDSYVAQFDATIDIKGTFFIKELVEERHDKMRLMLEKSFKCKLSDNGNSFNTCL